MGSLPGRGVDSTSPVLIGARTDLDGEDVTVNLQDDSSLQNTPDPAESDLVIELAAAPLHIEEGGVSTLTATTKAGATYSQDRTVILSFTGTATKDSDYTITPASVTITAGQTSGTAVIEALADRVAEPAETIIITALHDSRNIGAVTVTIQAEGGSGGSSGAFGVFEDVPAGAWYESALEWMILYQITAGCTPTMFCPEQNLTRQQFVTFLWRAAGRPAAPYLGSEAFGDVREGGYAEESIGWAVANGVTRGCTPGEFGDPDWNFCPTQTTTRGQMATLLYRHVEADYLGAVPAFADVGPDRFYTTSIAWLTDFGVVPGCGPGLFCPDRDATRAEAAVFINGVAIRPHLWGPGNTSLLGGEASPDVTGDDGDEGPDPGGNEGPGPGGNGGDPGPPPRPRPPVTPTVASDGAEIFLDFDQDLDTSAPLPDPSAFAVTIDAPPVAGSVRVRFDPSSAKRAVVTPTGVRFDNARRVVLVMDAPIPAGAQVRVAYTPPTTGGLQYTSSKPVKQFNGQPTLNRPDKPTITLNPGDSQLTVSWTPYDDDNAVTGYQVEYKVSHRHPIHHREPRSR